MEAVFLKVLNMSINATWLIAAIMLLRLVLAKAPKQLRCMMWGLAALRLVLPFSIESVLSMLPSAQTLPDNIIYTASPVIDSGIPLVDNAVNPILSTSLSPQPMTSANPTQILSFIYSQIWILGMLLMALYALFSWLHVRRKVAASIPHGKGIRLCDYIDSPFILGMFRPVIYLPSSLEEESMAYVMAHEQSHLKRRDHWWKPLGFAVLTLHWFNPAVWIAYVLLCRDIELACDERVIRELGTAEKQAYSTALLKCSIRRPYIAACPLAFGEVGVKQRIKSVLNYRKPGFWILLISLILCTVAVVCFLTDPVVDEYELEGTTIYYETDDTGRITFIAHKEEDIIYTLEGRTTYPHGATNQPYRLFPNGEIRDYDNQTVNIQYFIVTGLQRETETRLIDRWQYNMSSQTFTMDPGSDSMDQLTLCSFPDVPQDNNLAALAGFGEEKICTISLSSRIGIIGLRSQDTMEEFVKFLSSFQYDPIPVSDQPVSDEYICGGNVTAVAPINRNSHYLEESLNFSEDFSTVWTYYDGERGLPYAVLNPEGLKEYFTQRTTPAMFEAVNALPFASAEEPGKWLSNIHSGALEKVTIFYANTSTTGSGAYMTLEELEPLLTLLNRVPESALVNQKELAFFDDSMTHRGTLSFVFYDRANGIAVNLSWDGKTVKLTTYNNLDHVLEPGRNCPDASVWEIDFPELTQLLQQYCADAPTVTLFATQ